MLKVLPIQSKDKQKEICSLCGVEFMPNSFAYSAEDEMLIGICQFHFDNDNGYIDNLTYANNSSDWEAMIIMLRAAMNFMYRCNLKLVFLSNNTDEELIKKSGFMKNESGSYFIDVQKFYSGSCH